MGKDEYDISGMPRGGPDASWLSRRLQTDRLEYLDRDDVDDKKKRVVKTLDRYGQAGYEKNARLALAEVADIPSPKILDIGCGLGGLSRKMLEFHPTAELTVTDISPTFVADMTASDLGHHPRVTIRRMDASQIDAPDGYYDLAVFALALHHSPPEVAARVFAEGTRVADRFLIIDVRRPSPPMHLAMLAAVMPFAGFAVIHDAIISGLRAYSPSALQAIAHHADPAIDVEFRTARRGPTILVASRSRSAEVSAVDGRHGSADAP